MDAHVVYLSPGELADDGPRAGVVEQTAGPDAAARYAAVGEQADVRQDVPLVALIRTPVLTSEDTVRVLEAEWEGKEVKVVVEVRTYTGALFANVSRLGLVEVVLGECSAGAYTLIVVERTVPFEDLAHPERTGSATTETARYSFSVQKTAR